MAHGKQAILMTGLSEALYVKQIARIIDTVTLSWLHVHRGTLLAMWRECNGLLMCVPSTTARLLECVLGLYIVSKVAGGAVTAVLGMKRP